MKRLIEKVRRLKAIQDPSAEEKVELKRFVFKGLSRFDCVLDEYGDQFFEKELVRIYLAEDKAVDALLLASNGGKFKIPKYPILFARYYEARNEYKLASYYYLIHSKITLRGPESENCRKKSVKYHKLWLASRIS